MTAPKAKHFSMLRSFVLADFVTIGNGFSGAGAILALMQYLVSGEKWLLWLAFALFPIALALDFADGRIARWRQKSSALGADLDSLADVISFGMAVAALGFACGLRGALDIPVLLFFVACGISRLARFNVTAKDMADESGKVKYFEGAPIPSSLLLVGVLAVCAGLGRLGDALPLGVVGSGLLTFHPLVMLYAITGSAMISKTLHIPKI